MLRGSGRAGSCTTLESRWTSVRTLPAIRTVDEAIRWHGGEAEGARETYLALASKDRQVLLDWLQGL